MDAYRYAPASRDGGAPAPSSLGGGVERLEGVLAALGREVERLERASPDADTTKVRVVVL